MEHPRAFPTVLGLESSCDETAVGIVDGAKTIHANVIHSQIKSHERFGGVVPELAARAHLERLEELVGKAFTQSHLSWKNIDAIAVTGGPGLIGGVIVGVMAAKAMAAYRGLPFYAINHLEGHALTPRLTHEIPFPYLLLLVSGGHTQFLLVNGVGDYTLLGSTIDDAIGEAFDKTARLLDLPYPGGPKIEQEALRGDPRAYPLPKPLIRQRNCNFSLSGLKTAVRLCIEKEAVTQTPQKLADLCASFQKTVADIICDRLHHALEMAADSLGRPLQTLVVAGGVAANQYLRGRLKTFCAENKSVSGSLSFYAPDSRLCTDNGAMIAWAGVERIWADCPADTLDFAPRPRWPLEDLKRDKPNDS